MLSVSEWRKRFQRFFSPAFNYGSTNLNGTPLASLPAVKQYDNMQYSGWGFAGAKQLAIPTDFTFLQSTVSEATNTAPTSTIVFTNFTDGLPADTSTSVISQQLNYSYGGPLRYRIGRKTYHVGFGGNGPVRMMTSQGVMVLV
jgi:hypothetical protein